MKWASVAAYIIMMAGIVWLILRSEAIARTPPGIVVQALAFALMVWARIAFGRRSYHAAANPTAGGLVTYGPYRWLRHPIYAAILYFTWATAIDHHTRGALGAAVLVTTGAAFRMYAEETLLVRMYPEYVPYGARTARVIPFVV